jgi:hypothetical protein
MNDALVLIFEVLLTLILLLGCISFALWLLTPRLLKRTISLLDQRKDLG